MWGLKLRSCLHRTLWKLMYVSHIFVVISTLKTDVILESWLLLFILSVLERAFVNNLPMQPVGTLFIILMLHLVWAHIGGSVSLIAVGVLASHSTLNLCGVIGDGYYIAFVLSPGSIMLSSFAVPWFKYVSILSIASWIGMRWNVSFLSFTSYSY